MIFGCFAPLRYLWVNGLRRCKMRADTAWTASANWICRRTNKTNCPPAIHVSPGVVMSSNLHLFREIRMTDAKLTESILKASR